MKTLIIGVGPQGSGNHLYAKIFGSNPQVFAWNSLQHKYWEGHDMEPFADCWENPDLLVEFDTSTHDYYYTSMGCPYVYDGETRIPKFSKFDKVARTVFDCVKYMIIGRDRNILEHQQQRVRNRHSTPDFLQQLDFFMDKNPVFVSQELLYLYGLPYIHNIESQLEIPKNTNIDKINKILSDDQNRKYMNYVKHTELDELIKLASTARGAL